MVIAQEIALNDEKEKLILEGYLSKGLKNYEIAEKLGIHPSNVCRKLQKYNIKRTTKQELKKIEKMQQERNKVENCAINENIAIIPDNNIIDETTVDLPDDLNKISLYMKAMAAQGTPVSFKDMFTYLDNTKQLTNMSREEESLNLRSKNKEALKRAMFG